MHFGQLQGGNTLYALLNGMKPLGWAFFSVVLLILFCLGLYTQHQRTPGTIYHWLVSCCRRRSPHSHNHLDHEYFQCTSENNAKCRDNGKYPAEARTKRRTATTNAPANRAAPPQNMVVPFIVLQQPDWKTLKDMIEEFQYTYQTTLGTLSKSLEMAILIEGGAARNNMNNNYLDKNTLHIRRKRPLYSKHIRRKILRLSELFEEQEHILETKILLPFSATLTIASSSTSANRNNSMNVDDDSSHLFASAQSSQQKKQWNESNMSSPIESAPASNQNSMGIIRSKIGMAYQTASNLPSLFIPSAGSASNEENTDYNDDNQHQDQKKSAPASYESIDQIVAHLVRDWSELGEPVRRSLYGWSRSVLLQYGTKMSSKQQAANTVLVPGAGLGRLAWELAILDGHTVQALEVSMAMAAAASFVFRHHEKSDNEPVRVYPYIHDHFKNEVHSEDRYESVWVPDVNMSQISSSAASSISNSFGQLSYTVATFESLPSLPGARASFDAVVTCFFLDTATNLYQYLDIIYHILSDQGLWINVGPLHWHENSLLHGVAANELRELLEPDYEILHWSVDDEPVEYRDPARNPHQQHRRTHTFLYAYCPLRFVLRKK